MKVVVTGCCGFIGSHVCEFLLKRDDIVYGIDIMNDYYDPSQKEKNLNDLKKYNNFHFKQDDLVTTKIIDRVIPDVVVNLGAMAGVRYSLDKPEIYMKTNVEGQTHLLKRCIENKIKLFVYASSSSVYGLNTKVPFSETDQINNLVSPYALSKKLGEEVAELYHKLYGINVIGLRFFTVYGPRGRPDMAPYKFLNAIMKNEPIDKYGGGLSYRDYTYIDDIVVGIIGAIDNKCNKKCEIYNLGNSKPITLNEFIRTCEDVTGRPAIIRQQEEQKGDVPYTYADIYKAQKDLNYQPNTKLYSGLQRMFMWLRDN